MAEASCKRSHTQSLLGAIKKTSEHLQNNPITTPNNPQNTIKSLVELQSEIDANISLEPKLSKLSQLLRNLKDLLEELGDSNGYCFGSTFRRQVTRFKISQLAKVIEKEIQGWVDRELVRNWGKILRDSVDEEAKVKVLNELERRVSRGFDREFQELVLKAKVFSVLETILCDLTCSMKIREQAALAMAALVRFNKHVFVGLVLMGPTIQVLVSMASYRSIQVISSFIKLIRIPLVDEMESRGDMAKIITFLISEDLAIRTAALDCVLEIGYYGRKEVIEAMLERGLVKKLVALQRAATETARRTKREKKTEKEVVETIQFRDCVVRFIVQLEMGEGLEQKERWELKMEILRRVKEACVSEAEVVDFVVEIFWNSSP